MPRKGLIIFVVIVTIILLSNRQVLGCNEEIHSGGYYSAVSGDPGTLWCWAACIEYLTILYGCPEVQCQIVHYFCENFCLLDEQPWCGCPCEDCCQDPSPCWCHGYDNITLEAGMTDMHFVLDTEGLLSDASIYTQTCDYGNYILVYFEGEPSVQGDGHNVVVYGMTYNSPTGPAIDIYYMDPLNGTYEILYYNDFISHAVYKNWTHSIITSCYEDVSVGDIQSFSVTEDGNVINLDFLISGDANPNEKAAVYVSDNPYGPARIIEPLVDYAILYPDTNHWVDSWRAYNRYDKYYYFLDYDYEPFPDVRTTSATEVKAAINNPVDFFSGYPARPIHDSPDIINVSDYPCDLGTALHLIWDLSEDDTLLDCYNIYRSRFGEAFQYITAVPLGTNEYIDEFVTNIYAYKYMVSAAHHWTEWITGNYAIWNDFSDPSQEWIMPIDNVYEVNISLPSGDAISTCPCGSWDSLNVLLIVKDQNGAYTQGIPSDEIVLVLPESEDLYYCNNDTLFAEHDTDSLGSTNIVYSNIGGCSSVELRARVKGRYSNTVTLNIKSADINGDGTVSLIDYRYWTGGAYNTGCGDPNYLPCLDYDDNCRISILDFAYFCDHYNHACP